MPYVMTEMGWEIWSNEYKHLEKAFEKVIEIEKKATENDSDGDDVLIPIYLTLFDNRILNDKKKVSWKIRISRYFIKYIMNPTVYLSYLRDKAKFAGKWIGAEE